MRRGQQQQQEEWTTERHRSSRSSRSTGTANRESHRDYAARTSRSVRDAPTGRHGTAHREDSRRSERYGRQEDDRVQRRDASPAHSDRKRERGRRRSGTRVPTVIALTLNVHPVSRRCVPKQRKLRATLLLRAGRCGLPPVRHGGVSATTPTVSSSCARPLPLLQRTAVGSFADLVTAFAAGVLALTPFCTGLLRTRFGLAVVVFRASDAAALPPSMLVFSKPQRAPSRVQCMLHILLVCSL